jgi:hypothetical protein
MSRLDYIRHGFHEGISSIRLPDLTRVWYNYLNAQRIHNSTVCIAITVGGQ